MQGVNWPQIPQCLSNDSDMLPLIITSLCKWMPGATKPALDKDFRLVYRLYLELILLTITMKRALARGEFGGMVQPETCDRNSSVPSELVPVRSSAPAYLCLGNSFLGIRGGLPERRKLFDRIAECIAWGAAAVEEHCCGAASGTGPGGGDCLLLQVLRRPLCTRRHTPHRSRASHRT